MPPFSSRLAVDMADINIITKKERPARLISLELERLGLTYETSESPVKGAKLFIADLDTCACDGVPHEKVLAIGENKKFPHALTDPFLLSDLRSMLIEMLTNLSGAPKVAAQPRRKRQAVIELDPESSSVSVRRGSPVSLSPTEYKLLDALASRRGQVLTYAEAAEIIGGEGSNKANVYICFLRKKLESHGDKLIYSVRGKGFMIK